MNIWLDITTTLAWGRPALGIVRVEAETLRHFLGLNDDCVRFCRYERDGSIYHEVSHEDAVVALARLDAGGHGTPAEAEPVVQVLPDRPTAPPIGIRLEHWGRRAITKLPGRYQLQARRWAHHVRGALGMLSGAASRTVDRETLTAVTTPAWLQGYEALSPFCDGDVYISMGLDWDQKDLSLLYALKQRVNMKIMLFCYDIIPILMPEHCAPGVPEKFPGYFADVAWCADLVLCISECSRNDLEDYLHTVGAPIPELGIVRLGGDIPTSATLPPSTEIANLLGERYILFVSTIEARKNHRVLYQAYKRLLSSGKLNLPKLVFVGMQGWGVDHLICELHEDQQVQPYILRLQNISDSDLNHLYQNCLFTVYPSLYEGWGLPVAESLAYGKFCLASNAASIPEIGGDLVHYLPPQDESAWTEHLEWYFRYPEVVDERQEVIRRDYVPTSWKETGASILNAATVLHSTFSPTKVTEERVPSVSS